MAAMSDDGVSDVDKGGDPSAAPLGSWARLLSYVRPRVLEEFSTPHNPRLAVIESDGVRRLDGLSVNYSHGSLHTVLRSAFETLALRDRDVRSVLMLGFGGGSAVRLLREEHALDPEFTAVEIDPEVVALARRWFGFAADPRVRFVVEDAAEHVQTSRASHDLVLVDAFVDERVPDALCTRGFLRATGERVAPGGVLVFNTLADTLRRVLEAERIENAARAELAGVTRIDVDQNRLVVWERARKDASSAQR